jgi:Skp family chaperone for outer membrane proteins
MNFSTITKRPFARLGLCALIAAAVGVAFVAGSSTSTASAVQAASPSAVAVVDLAELLEGLEERAYLEGKLNEEIADRQAELDSIIAEVERMREQIGMLKDDASRMPKIRDMRIKEVEARALNQFVQEQLSLEKGQMLATIYNKVQTAAGKILARDGWDVILIDDSGLALPEMAQEAQMLQLILNRRVLASASKGVDITADVQTLMNNEFANARP